MVVSVNRTGPLYVGTGLALTCIVTLDMSVNNNEMVSLQWSAVEGMDEHFPNSGTGLSDTQYTSNLIISPLTTEHAGVINCTATVRRGSEKQIVSNSNVTVLNIEGESACNLGLLISMIICSLSVELPIPQVTVSGATVGEAGEQYRLMCTVTTVDHLTPTAILSISWSGGSVGTSGVNNGDLDMTSGVGSALIFDPLKTLHGGNYKCQAEINISSIHLTVTNTTDRDVVVRSKSVAYLCN